MRILLDTHIFLWSIDNHSRLTPPMKEIMLSAEQIFVSSVSIWEIAIKINIGKLQGDMQDIVKAIDNSNFIELPMTVAHAAKIHSLPNYHSDPFDRMLIAQAMTEPLKLLTVDSKFEEYSDLIILFN